MRRLLLLLPLACGGPSSAEDSEGGSTAADPATTTTPTATTTTSSSTSTPTSTSTSSDDGSSGEPATLGEQLFAAGFESEVANWELIREEPSGWRIQNDRFELRSFPGTLWEESNNTTNVAVRPLPADTFTARVTIEGHIDVAAEQGGLLWYVDDDNYVKLVKEQVGGVIVVVMVTEREGVPEVDSFGPLGQDIADLRLTVTADTLTGAYRPSADEAWTDIATTDRLTGKNPRIGLFSQGADVERWSSFSNFSY